MVTQTSFITLLVKTPRWFEQQRISCLCWIYLISENTASPSVQLNPRIKQLRQKFHWFILAQRCTVIKKTVICLWNTTLGWNRYSYNSDHSFSINSFSKKLEFFTPWYNAHLKVRFGRQEIIVFGAISRTY